MSVSCPCIVMVLSYDTSEPKNFPADYPRELSCTVQRFPRLTRRRRQLVPKRRTLKRRDLQCTLRTVSGLLLFDALETMYLQVNSVHIVKVKLP